jgi:hypothetical protein
MFRMMIARFRAPSPPLVVAIAAFVFAIGGSASALTASSPIKTIVRQATGAGKLAVYCNTGETVTGGGVASNTGAPVLTNLPLRGSHDPRNGHAANGWGGETQGDASITVYVVCEQR